MKLLKFCCMLFGQSIVHFISFTDRRNSTATLEVLLLYSTRTVHSLHSCTSYCCTVLCRQLQCRPATCVRKLAVIDAACTRVTDLDRWKKYTIDRSATLSFDACTCYSDHIKVYHPLRLKQIHHAPLMLCLLTSYFFPERSFYSSIRSPQTDSISQNWQHERTTAHSNVLPQRIFEDGGKKKPKRDFT